MNAKQSPQQFQSTVNQDLRARYLLFLPAAYESAPAAPWPLLLFLHGAGERGANLSRVAAHGPPHLVSERPDFPFIVVSPQCPAGEAWSKGLLLHLLKDVQERYNVDPNRVYLTGLSMGGYGTWELALAHPEKFAAIVPLCGGGTLLPVLLATTKQLRAIRSLGVWAFHGAKDSVVPLLESERMIAALKEVGNRAKLTVYPNSEHDCWTETYANPALYKWLLSHRRRAIKP